MPDRVFGSISGYPLGSTFADRRALKEAGLHRQLQAGISGSERDGADAIVLSGGYKDDLDLGDEIIYTGEGGRNPVTGQQVNDQRLRRGNLALERSMAEGLPVRVIRGAHLNSRYAPDAGYRYDGLYQVTDMWAERGHSGHIVWRYRLEKMPAAADEHVAEAKTSYRARRRTRMVEASVRDPRLSRKVKEYHDSLCIRAVL